MSQLNQDELVRIFAEVLEVDPHTLTDQSCANNVKGWDSAKSLEIVITLEEAVSFEFDAEELSEMVSIGATKQILIRRGVFIQQ
jgi:acyl carrier protein